MTQLEKKVKIVKNIYLYGRDSSNILRDLFIAGNIELVEAYWNDRFKSEHLDMCPLNLKEKDLWSIYEICSDMHIKFVNGKIYAEVRIYEGDSWNGNKKNLRWEGKFLFNSKSLTSFTKNINWKFESHLEDLYDKELEAIKQSRMKEISKDILNLIK